MMVLGFAFGSASGDSDSGWYMVAMVGMFPLMGAGYIWLFSVKDNSQKLKEEYEDDDF